MNVIYELISKNDITDVSPELLNELSQEATKNKYLTIDYLSNELKITDETIKLEIGMDIIIKETENEENRNKLYYLLKEKIKNMLQYVDEGGEDYAVINNLGDDFLDNFKVLLNYQNECINYQERYNDLLEKRNGGIKKGGINKRTIKNKKRPIRRTLEKIGKK